MCVLHGLVVFRLVYYIMISHSVLFAVFQYPAAPTKTSRNQLTGRGISPNNDFFVKISVVGLQTRRLGKTIRLDVRTTCRIFNDG